MGWDEGVAAYKVVISQEEQYEIWPADLENKKGWKDTEMKGTKKECEAYIKEMENDLRSANLRKKMDS